MEKIRKVVIPAAGFGTRFLPATKAMPKEMLPIVDKPTIQFVVEEALDSGIDDIIIVTGKNKRTIEDHFDRSLELELHLQSKGDHALLKHIKGIGELADIHYVRQKEQLGLGHAIYCTKKHIDGEDFAVLLGDTIIKSKEPCTKQLIDVYNKRGATVIAVEEVAKENIEKYGVVDGKRINNELYEIKKLVEKPKASDAPSNLGIIGRYVLTSRIFDAIEEMSIPKSGELQLTDALAILCGGETVYGYLFKGIRYDIGDKLDYLRASIEYALHKDELRAPLVKYLKNLNLEKN